MCGICRRGRCRDLPLLEDAPPRVRQAFYQAFGIELFYNKDQNQVTIYATITTSTPQTVAAIINDSEPPTPPARYPFPLANSSAIGSSSALRSPTRFPIPPSLAAARDGQDLLDTA